MRPDGGGFAANGEGDFFRLFGVEEALGGIDLDEAIFTGARASAAVGGVSPGGGLQGFHVDGRAGGYVAVVLKLAARHHQDPVAKLGDGGHVVADEQNGPAVAGDLANAAEAFFLELGVADAEDFIDDQNFRIEMRRDGEGKAHIHAAASSA